MDLVVSEMYVDIKNLTLGFGKKIVLDNLSLQLEHGVFTGIIGPNGSGKSTMLKTIYRTIEVAEKAVFIDGKPVEEYSFKETAQKQAVLAQHNYYNFDFKVLDVVLMGRSPYKEAMDDDNEYDYALARGCLEIVGMEAFENSNFSVLSGGEQQRVMLARALTQETPCLILDEPTNHLDIKYQLQLLNIIKSRRLTVFAALHDLNIAALYCDKLIAIKDGHVVASGTPAQVLTKDFIKNVFEVNADIFQRADGKPLIVYHAEVTE